MFIKKKIQMMFPDESKAIIEKINDPFLNDYDVQLFIKREDLIHPYISGNKWRKLKYNLVEAKRQEKQTLLSFGGAFSNHIYALAAAGKLYDFKTIGIIRGDKPLQLNSTLKFATDNGMLLYYIDRSTYRLKDDPVIINSLYEKYDDFYLIPEGGTNNAAITGCKEILTPADYKAYDYICCCCATGGTLTGIIEASDNTSNIIGFCTLKGDFLTDTVANLLSDPHSISNWKIINSYHFGGYAKSSPILENFISSFLETNNIQLEFVYTGKMFFGIYDMIKQGYFEKGSKILAIHTGGIRNH